MKMKNKIIRMIEMEFSFKLKDLVRSFREIQNMKSINSEIIHKVQNIELKRT
jgi:hypothetical protein